MTRNYQIPERGPWWPLPALVVGVAGFVAVVAWLNPVAHERSHDRPVVTGLDKSGRAR